MRTFRNKRFYIILVLFMLLLIIYLIRDKISKNSQNSSIVLLNQPTPLVIWWTNIIPDYHRNRQCGIYNCTFTTKRNFMTNNLKKAFLFYGSELNYTDLPLPRYSDHIWGLLHEESPKNVPFIQYEEILKYFNLTATFSRYSNFPLTTQYLDSLDVLTSQKYLIPIGEKSKLRIKQKLAPVVFIQSICDTLSGRNEYVQELMKYIDVDSYGKCLNNKDMPQSLTTDYLQKIDSDGFYKFLSRYKFIISYENGVCDDYITEKFWRPLIIGSVPIYFGAPTIRDWMPNKNSAILIEDFGSPKDLAKYLKYLDSNDIEYNKFLDHKYSQKNPVTNKILMESLMYRNYKKSDNFFENFECFICSQLYRNVKSVADQRHYNCGDSIQFPMMETNMKNSDIYSSLKYGKCQALVINDFLMENKNFTSREFHAKMSNFIETEKCKL